jgi:hypothetical protein
MSPPAPQLPPVLRYRLRAKPGDRPSSLAHTGEPLLEPDLFDATGRSGPPFRCKDAFSAAKDGSCEGPPSWIQQFPSEPVYHQNIVYGGETSTAALFGVAAAADGRSFWMEERTKMLQTAELLAPPLLPLAAVASLLNWSSSDAPLRHAFALS